MMWKDFFYFTKTERQGILVLVVLIIVFFSLPYVFLLQNQAEETDASEQELAEKEFQAFIASLKTDSTRLYSSESKREIYKKREIRLAAFDPNTADSATFLSLGLPAWMARNILRYRSRQGQFRKPEDFKKVYGLTEEQYRMLRPYIQIAPLFQKKDSMQTLLLQTKHKDTLFKYLPGTRIELNTADTTELKKIPGIGSGIARRIVAYRQRLGGYSHIGQLKEIHLKAELLHPWFTIDERQIHPININKASLEKMMRHPYISFYQAKVIIEYRKKKGNISSLKQLSLYEEFTPADWKRLVPYICFTNHAVHHMNSPVGDLCQSLVVRHNNKRLSQAVSQFKKQLMQFLLIMCIQTSGRFIGQYDCRIINQGTGHRYPLFFTSREFIGLMSSTIGQPHKFQHVHGTGMRLFRRDIGYKSRNHHIFQCRKLREQLMKLKHEADVLIAKSSQFPLLHLADHGSVNLHPSRIRFVQSAHNLQQSSLTSPTRPYNTDNLALVDGQINAFQHLQRTKTFRNTF